MTRAALPAVVCLIGCLGCGGASRSVGPSSPRTVREEPVYAPAPAEAERAGESDATTGAPRSHRDQLERQPNRYAQPPNESKGLGIAGDDLNHLLEDLSVAESLALSARTGCEQACRALRSMVRSANKLCALAANETEQRACDEARLRIRNAKAHVRNACGQCADGPDLNAD